MVKGLLVHMSSLAGTGVSVPMSSLGGKEDDPSNHKIIMIIITIKNSYQLMYTRYSNKCLALNPQSII